MMAYRWPLLTIAALLLFLLAATHIGPRRDLHALQVKDRVVISGPIQLLLYGGDRFLAADLETMRLAATTSVDNHSDTAHYLSRAHLLVAQLNPCHEDNYYLGSALLSWGGAEVEGSELLARATECRYWDWVPPFFYGFYQYYFHKNGPEAQRGFNLAADRSPANAASLRKTGIMMMAGQLDDNRMAIDYLKHQHEQTTDHKLRQMLQQRIGRLEGLQQLRDAQKQYQQQFKRPLQEPQQLLTHRILDSFPPDPLGIGYVFEEGSFNLRKLKIAGTEER